MGSGRKPGPVLLPDPPTTQGPEGHSGVQPGHFSLAAPLPCETPLREEQALCKNLKAWCPDKAFLLASAYLGLRSLHGLLLEKHQPLDKHMSLDGAIPSCSPKPGETNLSPIQPSKQPMGTTTHDAHFRNTPRDTGRKGTRRGPRPQKAPASKCAPSVFPHGVADIANQSSTSFPQSRSAVWRLSILHSG